MAKKERKQERVEVTALKNNSKTVRIIFFSVSLTYKPSIVAKRGQHFDKCSDIQNIPILPYVLLSNETQ